ncbi:diguanylate cyclase (GGDEF)-like protein [Hoeflea marina]|uniref:diguanylate cyclase n=1 Tax=Hoeflea marina TaxID=274592 RepID=A0A317PV07_9HYPH|nr:GGDEF domain-containing protein [Hoeflea marina]PWW04524.1 diguanylate cyclase (GGDEF)-like protein [Hoeflea marina]
MLENPGSQSGIRNRRLTQLAWVCGGTLACILVSFSVAHLLARDFSAEVLLRAHLASIFLPMVLATPLLGVLMIKIGHLEDLNARLVGMATSDLMTGLLNRTAFAGAVSALLDSPAERIEVTLLVIDADHFKQINDRFGHQAGDLALTALADCIRRNVRSTDLVGRLGGEEFGVAMAGVNAENGHYTAERIRRAVANIDFRPHGIRHDITVSIGVTLSASAADFASLFKDADERLYAAKTAGRNVVKAGFMGEASLSSSEDLPGVSPTGSPRGEDTRRPATDEAWEGGANRRQDSMANA